MVAATKKRRLINADKPLTLVITPRHIERAVCGDPAECVIAQALQDHYGVLVDGFQVGSNITKIYTSDKIVRYRTPGNLANSLRVFDKTGKWHLPPGEYTLRPFVQPPNRWHKAKRHGGVQSIFKGRKSAPTRYAMTVCELKAA